MILDFAEQLNSSSHYRWAMEIELELVTSLSEEELEALANSVLAPSAQSRLDTLLEKKSDGLLTTLELSELDALLSQVDQLTILKTRSRFTLQQHAKAAGA
jgi:hypothetical protein